MKKLILILSATVFLFCSCKKVPKERIEKDVTIGFLLRSGGGVSCAGEWCGSIIDIKNGESNFKSKFELPDSILNKWEWWNREYVATIKFLDDTCHCKNGDIDLNPNVPDATYPEYDLRMIEILKIREK